MRYIMFITILSLFLSSCYKQEKKEVVNLKESINIEISKDSQELSIEKSENNSKPNPLNTDLNLSLDEREQNKEGITEWVEQYSSKLDQTSNIANSDKIKAEEIESIITNEEEKEIISELEEAINDIWNGNWENELKKINAFYKNPKTQVDMIIEYSLDEEGKIEKINANATTYDLTKFDENIQILVWKTIDEAKETYISWGSLTTKAFKEAIKDL